jgi:FkbM family methyltransferase
MHPRLTFLLLPYTRAELPAWGKLMKWMVIGPRGSPAKPEWQTLPAVIVRGKCHGYLMKLDRSDWAQRFTYFLGRYYELGVQRVMDVLLRPGDSFVDIGANIGMITLHARHLVGAAGRIECFEPNPECVEAIREHLRINGIENAIVHPCALSDSNGSLLLKLTSDHTGTATLAEVGSDAVRSMTVDVRIGDEMIGTVPRLIKIDVEGFELQVLRGLRHTLSKYKPFLLTELSESLFARAGTSVAEVAGFLFDLGYAAFGIGTARKIFRHELVLSPLAPDGDFSSFTDVLWAPPERRQDLSHCTVGDLKTGQARR